MTLKSDLEQQVKLFFTKQWSRRDGVVVPDAEDVKLSNDGVDLEAVVLYADLAESTHLVSNKKDIFAAAVYKSFLYCAARIIERRGGTVTAYDGDRVMGVFVGNAKRSEAARAALNINHATKKIVMPALKAKYTSSEYVVQHCVGVDISKLLVARTGVRGANDLVWVGNAANRAAKLSALRVGYSSIVTDAVYSRLRRDSKFDDDGNDMWTALNVQADLPNVMLYGSRYTWGAYEE
jgi:class 3 adenylate cyclase